MSQLVSPKVVELPKSPEPLFPLCFNELKYYDVAIDVGAYVGQWTIPLAERFDTVYAFEPITPNFEALFENTKRYPNVIRRNIALGDLTAKCVMNNSLNGGKAYDWRCGPALKDNTQVDITTLDSLDIKRVSFIKVNTNGHEFRVMRGARATIENYKPLVLINEEYDPHRQASAFLVHLGMRELWVRDRNFLFGW